MWKQIDEHRRFRSEKMSKVSLFDSDHAQWKAAVGNVKSLAKLLLVAAISAAGLNTKVRQLAKLTLKPLLVGVAAAVIVGLVSLALVYALDPVLEKAFPLVMASQ